MTRTLRMGLGLALALYCGTAMAIDFHGRSFDCAPNQTVFVSGFQRYATLKKSGAPKTTYKPTAGAIGYVWQQDNWKAGAALSWEDGNRKYSRGGYAKVSSSMPGISVFGTMNLSNDWYVDGSAFVGFRSMRMKGARVDGVGSFGDSDRVHKTVFALGLEGGRNFMLGNDFIVTPHAGIDYAYTPRETFTASGRGFNVSSQNYWEIPLGVTLKKTFFCGDWAVTPKVDATFVSSLGDMDAKNVQPGFAYRTADSWKVAGIGGGHVGGRLTTGIDAKLGNRTSVGLDYTYEVRKNYGDHRVSAMFGLSF